MDNSELFELIEKLSFHSKCKVQHLVIELVAKAIADSESMGLPDIFGKRIFMANDFNEPIKDFHEYTYTISLELVNKIEELPLVSKLKSKLQLTQCCKI